MVALPRFQRDSHPVAITCHFEGASKVAARDHLDLGGVPFGNISGLVAYIADRDRDRLVIGIAAIGCSDNDIVHIVTAAVGRALEVRGCEETQFTG